MIRFSVALVQLQELGHQRGIGRLAARRTGHSTVSRVSRPSAFCTGPAIAAVPIGSKFGLAAWVAWLAARSGEVTATSGELARLGRRGDGQLVAGLHGRGRPAAAAARWSNRAAIPRCWRRIVPLSRSSCWSTVSESSSTWMHLPSAIGFCWIQSWAIRFTGTAIAGAASTTRVTVAGALHLRRHDGRPRRVPPGRAEQVDADHHGQREDGQQRSASAGHAAACVPVLRVGAVPPPLPDSPWSAPPPWRRDTTVDHPMRKRKGRIVPDRLG